MEAYSPFVGWAVPGEGGPKIQAGTRPSGPVHREGHYGAALLVYTPLGFVAFLLGFETLAVGGALAAGALAMVPDLDVRVPGLKHRGPTHTVWFALAVGVATGVAGWVLAGQVEPSVPAPAVAGFGALVGFLTVCSHIGADALTPMGVRPFAPADRRKFTLSVTTADSTLANYLLLALGVGAAAGALALATRL